MRTGDKQLFTIYEHPTQGFQAVKVGFSWLAFFLTIIWMLVHRLWRLLAIWIGLYIVVHIAEGFVETLDDSSLTYLLLLIVVLIGWGALCLVPGYRGNSWREKDLLSRGYNFIQAIRAESVGDAISKAKLTASSKVSQMPVRSVTKGLHSPMLRKCSSGSERNYHNN